MKTELVTEGDKLQNVSPLLVKWVAKQIKNKVLNKVYSYFNLI